jgi:hypothetical protein
MDSIREQVLEAEQHAELEPGDDERFSGYGVMGLTFSSGHDQRERASPRSLTGDA